MMFLLQMAIKGQALAYFLDDNLASNAVRIYEGFPNEVAEVFAKQTAFNSQVWQLYFDGASRSSQMGTRSPEWGLC